MKRGECVLRDQRIYAALGAEHGLVSRLAPFDVIEEKLPVQFIRVSMEPYGARTSDVLHAFVGSQLE